MKAVVDNDVLLKGACYGLLDDFAAILPGDGQFGYLGAARFVITKRLGKLRLRGSVETARKRLDEFLVRHLELEPTIPEQSFAAKLEVDAQRLLVNLDSGESQLAAILLLRAVPFLLTGDKRAIVALERLLESDQSLNGVAGKVVCIERLLQMLILTWDESVLRAAVCAEPDVDRAISICFSCSSSEANAIVDGLNSYISDLRRNAPSVMAT